MMRVYEEHLCEPLENQRGTSEIMAVQLFGVEKQNKVNIIGWFLASYTEKKGEKDCLYGIKYCPYCGEQLRK